MTRARTVCALIVFSAIAGAAAAQSTRPAGGSPSAAARFATIRQQADEARAGGRLDEAIGLYERAIRLRPSWIEGYWYLGATSYELEKYARCRDAFRNVVRRQPQNGAAWAFKGLCEFQLTNYRTALSDLTTAHDRQIGDPKLIPVARYHRAILLTRFGEFERALQIYALFGSEGNVTPQIVEGIGLAVLRMPRLPADVPEEQRDLVMRAGRATALSRTNGAEAEREYEALVRGYGETPNVHYVYGLFLLRDRPELALAQFREELRVSPTHAPAMIQIAQELLKEGDRDGAARWAGEAVQLAPRHFVARRVLGQVKLEAGDIPGAIAELESAVKLEPDSPSVHYTLARAYQRAGRSADAERERATFTKLERLQQEQRGAVEK